MIRRFLAVAAAACLVLSPVVASGQTIGGGGGVSVPFTAACGSVSVSTVCWGVTETWTQSGVVYAAPLQVVVTNTASGAGSLLFNLLAGASGTTSEFSVDRTGNVTTGGMTVASGGGYNFSGLGSAYFITAGASGLMFQTGANIATLTPGANNSATFNGPIGTQVTTVSGLETCAAGTKGHRSFVTDATASTFMSAVVGGGATNVPVVCDATSWKIG